MAIVVGCNAWRSRRDAKRNPISGLLKLVADRRREFVESHAKHLTEVRSPASGFASRPQEQRRIVIDQLQDLHSARRGLDLAHGKLLVEADAAWGVGPSLRRQMEGMNPEADAQFNELMAQLRAKHL